MSTERKTCTKESPMPEGAEGRWLHPDAKRLPSTSDYYDTYRCPHCGKVFDVELPE